MKYKKSIGILVLFFVTIISHAQQATVASGGDASGSGGTVAYSVGQIDCINISGTNGIVAQGVQQPYEISLILGTNNHSIDLALVAYPNPTSNFLTLNIGNLDFSELSFQLFDINGKLIESRKIISNAEKILMENLQNATYVFKIINSNKELKTFKIIKN